MSSVSVYLNYRPIRIGWCIRNEDFEGFRSTARLNYACWGGVFNPFIPVDDVEFGKVLVETFRPDVLFAVGEDAQVTAFIESFPHLKPSIGKTSVTDGEEITHLDISHPLMMLHQGSGFSSYTDFPLIPKWTNTDPLSDVFLVTLGEYPSNQVLSVDYASRVMAEKNGTEYRIENLAHPLDPKVFIHPTPASLSGAYIDPMVSRLERPGVFIGRAGSFQDLIAFWNLRAANLKLIFYDYEYSARLGSWLKHQEAAFQKVPGRFQGDVGFPIYSRSADVLRGDFPGFSAIPRLLHHQSGPAWTRQNLRPPQMTIGNSTCLGNVFTRASAPTLSVELKDKPYSDNPIFTFQRLVVSVRSIHSGRKTDDFTFSSIYCPEMNEFYGRETNVGYDEVRSEPDGLGFIVTTRENHLSISAIRKQKIVEKLFSIFGATLEQSKPGLIARQICRQVGGIQGCRVFKIEGVRTLLNSYKPTDSFNSEAALCRIGNVDPQTNRPRFDKYKKLAIEYLEGVVERTPKHTLRYLLKKKILRPGLSTSCPNCQMDFWTPVDDVESMLVCTFCGNEKDVASELIEKKWEYRKSGLFGHDDNQQGAIPVLATVQQLDTCLRAFDSLFLLFASTIKGPGLECESDFVAVVAGNQGISQIVLAECKTNGPIEEQDLRNLVAAASKFPPDRFETYILLSKTSNFTQVEVDLVNRFRDELQGRVIMWAARELDHYEVYKETQGRFQFQKYNTHLDGLAQATEAIYLNPRPTPAPT